MSLLHKYTNKYTNKCGDVVTSKPVTTSAREKLIDVSEHTTSNVYKTHSQQQQL